MIRRELPLTTHASPAEPVANFRRGFSFVLVARELLGFIWAIGIKAEAMACKQQMAACAPQANRGRIGLELSTPAPRGSQAAQTTGRAPGRDHRDCMESAEPSA